MYQYYCDIIYYRDTNVRLQARIDRTASRRSSSSWLTKTSHSHTRVWGLINYFAPMLAPPSGSTSEVSPILYYTFIHMWCKCAIRYRKARVDQWRRFKSITCLGLPMAIHCIRQFPYDYCLATCCKREC